ncbi:MAG: hypothetical protein SCK70_10425 [bacterium]|nr:hypothetical protein [bacterium]
MTAKERLKKMIDDLPDDQLKFIDQVLKNLLNQKNILPPKGDLGLKKTLNREDIYDDILADRH